MENGINTSLIYLENDGKYLMLHRVKKKDDINKDKWIGVGGKFEKGETPLSCAKRELFEETGLKNIDLNYRGIVTFILNKTFTEYMHLFTGKIVEEKDLNLIKNIECQEGNLEWIKKEKVLSLPIWEGDKIFLKLLNEESRFFNLTLEYAGDKLIDSKLTF